MQLFTAHPRLQPAAGRSFRRMSLSFPFPCACHIRGSTLKIRNLYLIFNIIALTYVFVNEIFKMEEADLRLHPADKSAVRKSPSFLKLYDHHLYVDAFHVQVHPPVSRTPVSGISYRGCCCSSSVSTNSILLTETSKATLFSACSSSSFFMYSRLWIRPQMAQRSPT